MDKYNVIVPTNNLDELTNDMVNWSELPFNFRMRSNEECIKRYNMTNIDLYNKIKSSILNNKPLEDLELIGNNISESIEIENTDKDSEINDKLWKNQLAKQLQQSPNIVIIEPFIDDSEPEYDLETLENKFYKYSLLTSKNRRFSNSYSISLYSYDVPNMYLIMRNKLNDKEFKDDEVTFLKESKEEKAINPLSQLVNEYIISNNKLGLLNIQLDYLAVASMKEKYLYKNILEDSKYNYKNIDFLSILPKVVPYFTIDECKKFDIDLDRLSAMNNREYSKALMEAKSVSDLLSLAWNPCIAVNEESLEFARKRQAAYLNRNACKIVDLTKTFVNESIINESSILMNNMYKSSGLYPIYITLTYKTNGIFSNIIRAVKHSEYTHAGLSLDSNLMNVSTFAFCKESKGFANDSIQKYVDGDKKCLLMVLALFVDKDTKKKIELVLKDFITKQDKSIYGFGNLFNILINKSADNDPENLYLVCSQFVDTVLKLANIKLHDKSSNLVIPEDFKAVANSNPKVFKVYEGKAIEYNEKKVEDLIYNLFKLNNIDTLKYSNSIEESMLMTKDLSGYYTETDNEEANNILKEARELLKIEPAIVNEWKFPIKIGKNGDVTIKLFKSLENEYQEAHRLLLQYGEDNVEGIKHELARLFYVNTSIENKLQKLDDKDPAYKKFIDLRARVLNDFKKYMKIVLAKEPDFDFAKYFEESEYYNSAFIIDNSIIKAIIALLKSLGLKKK